MHANTQDSALLSSTVPVSINDAFYSSSAFVDEINKGYKKDALKGSNHNFRYDFSAYTARNISRLWHKPALMVSYDAVSPSEFNGINRWQSCFDHFHADLNKRFNVDNYLNDVLVKNLNIHIQQHFANKPVTCGTYKDYIFSCLKYDYAPPLDIRWSDQKGWGVYSKENLYPFTFVGLYTGQFKFTLATGITERVLRQHNKYIWLMTYNILFCVDAQRFGNFTRFINHDEQNSKRVVTLSLQVAKGNDRISIPHNGFMVGYDPSSTSNAVFESGEEVVWDYGPGYKFD